MLDAGPSERPPKCATYLRSDATNDGVIAGTAVVSWRLEPAGAAEHAVQHDCAGEHDEQGDPVSVAGVEFGHVMEVHALNARDSGLAGGDSGPGGDLAHVVVLVDVHLSESRLQDGVEEVVEAGHPLDHSQQVVVDVAEVAAELLL